MNGGGSQSPSYSTGSSGGSSSSWGKSGMGASQGWQQPFSSSNPSVSPFFNLAQQQAPQQQWSSQQTQMPQQPAQATTQPASFDWSSLSPTLNYFSQLAATQPQQQSVSPPQQQAIPSAPVEQATPSPVAQTPLDNQNNVNAALQQQAAQSVAQPTSIPTPATQQNFTLADANRSAGLPAAGQAPPAQSVPQAAPQSTQPAFGGLKISSYIPPQRIKGKSASTSGQIVLSDGRVISVSTAANNMSPASDSEFSNALNFGGGIKSGTSLSDNISYASDLNSAYSNKYSGISTYGDLLKKYNPDFKF